MSELYIPPEGIYFRLLGYNSNCCIYSRKENDPCVWHYDVSHGACADQWFSVLKGTGSHANLYAIKGKDSGKVLYSRANNDPRVYHIDGDGKYEDKLSFFSIRPTGAKMMFLLPPQLVFLRSRHGHIQGLLPPYYAQRKDGALLAGRQQP
jgi:hypothetical protein